MHYFSTQPVFDQNIERIDRDNGIITGVTVAKLGAAKGHNAKIDKTFLMQLVDQANARPQGIKARFGHPNMCSTALGSYLGRFKSYSYHTDHVKANLHLDKTAQKSPSGNLYDYMLDMAESNPDMFGASIAFQSDEFEVQETEAEGKKVQEKFFRLKELRATDIVDEPAATDGLFSAGSFAGQATRLLDENPIITEFIFSSPERVIEFLNNYLINTDMQFSDQIKSRFRSIFNMGATPQPQNLPDPEPTPVQENPTQAPPATDPLEQPTTADPQPSDTISEASLSELTAFRQFVNSLFEYSLSVINERNIELGSDGSYSFNTADNQVNKVSESMKMDNILLMINTLIAGFEESSRLVSTLQAKVDATPVIPTNVSDPQVKIELADPSAPKATGSILAHMPKDLRYKFKHSSHAPTQSK